MQKLPKVETSSVIIRFLTDIARTMNPKDREMFCRAIEDSMNDLKLQLNEYKDLKWYGASKRRSDSLRHLEKEKTVCKNLEYYF